MTWTRFEAIVSFIGGVLGIFTFIWQFGPAIRERWRRGDNTSEPAAPPVAPVDPRAASDSSARRAALLQGIACALLAALLWSIGHVSFRTATARAASPMLLSAFICLTGGAALFLVTWLLGRRLRQNYGPVKLGTDLVGPLGLILLTANAAEFIGYLYAMHYSSAGQTMAIWKSNVLWLLVMLALFRQRLPAKASVAAVFCVLMGIYTILGPDIRSGTGTDPVVGAGFALGGGLLFAVYSFALFKVFLRFPNAMIGDRLWLQSAILFSTGVILIMMAYLLQASLEPTKDTLNLVVLNGLRIAVVYVLYSEAIRLTGHPVLVAAVVALEVPLTIGIETWYFGQPVPATLLVGALIVLIGVVSIIHENELLKRAAA